MTAIYGYNFCAGAIKSFALIIANIARAAVLDQVTNLVLFMGKVRMEYLFFLNQVFTIFCLDFRCGHCYSRYLRNVF